jgi:F0F1-type ATP synthase assembly protein I
MKPNILFRMFLASSTAAMIVGPVILSVMVGLWLDGLFLTSPFLTLAGGIVGFVGSILALLKALHTKK